jgi:hypothetical protein
MSYRLTKTQIKKEILSCGKDPSYFINNYIKIAHPLKGMIPFNLYPFQKDVLDNFCSHRFNIVLKARQLGISTTTAGYIAWLLLFHRNKNVVVMATKLQTAANLVKKVKLALKHVPSWMMISNIVVDNKNSFELDNGSQVKAISTSGDAGRSEALSLLVIDEAAIVEGIEELWAGLYPTLSTGGDCIIVSTPNGVGNLFHKLYSEAEQGLNDFNSMLLPWDVHPERDQEWFDKETRSMSVREIAQELECNFNMSGETLIDGEDLERIYKLELQEPRYKVGFDRNIWVWEQPQENKKYFLVADVARGDGKDNSTFYVFDSEEMTMVSEYKGKVPLDVFTKLIFDVSKQYGECLTVVENNSLGITVLNSLKEMGHRNIYCSRKSTHEYIEQSRSENMPTAILGFTTSSKTRPIIIAKLEESIRNRVIKIKSKRLYNELKTFVWYHGRPEAMRGYNDDLVMAAAIGCWVRDTALIANKQDIAYKRAMLNSIFVGGKKMDTRLSDMKMGRKRELKHIYKDNKVEKIDLVDIRSPFLIR